MQSRERKRRKRRKLSKTLFLMSLHMKPLEIKWIIMGNNTVLKLKRILYNRLSISLNVWLPLNLQTKTMLFKINSLEGLFLSPSIYSFISKNHCLFCD
jgi:hypothetical protein